MDYVYFLDFSIVFVKYTIKLFENLKTQPSNPLNA